MAEAEGTSDNVYAYVRLQYASDYFTSALINLVVEVDQLLVKGSKACSQRYKESSIRNIGVAVYCSGCATHNGPGGQKLS